jgi:hypothetical protein
MRPFGREHVESAHTKHVEAGVQTGADIDGHNHDDGVMNQVSIHGKRIKQWPPFHFSVNHERHGESCALIEVDQMLLGVMSPLLVDSLLVISLFQFIFYLQISFNTDLKSMDHSLSLLSYIGVFAGCKLEQLFVIFLLEAFFSFCLMEL